MSASKSSFNFKTAEDFDPSSLGQSLCMNFEAAISSFTENPDERIHGALSGYIYDVPQFPGDRVNGGIHYAKYVQLPTSLIPQKQPSLLKEFAESIKHAIEPGATFFDLGPGPEWSVRRNTLPSIEILQPSSYIPVDLEPEFTEEACKVVSEEFLNIKVKNLALNFHQETLPKPETTASIVWYPGSTLGNLPSLPNQPFVENRFVQNHLERLRRFSKDQDNQQHSTRYLVVLMDRKKDDIQSMLDLYKSSDAVACFQSILYKLQRDLKAESFDPDAFVYNQNWNPSNSAVEHVFTSTKAQEFKVHDCFTGSSAIIKVKQDEKYVLAHSFKPSHEDMRTMLICSGWNHLQSATDSDGQFHIHLAKVG
jgi:uncharacterized SAM-dependent methyltransferase